MKQFVRFILVGLTNTLFGYALIFGLMYVCGLPAELSNLAGYTIAFAISYLLHRRITFRSLNAKRTEFLRYSAVFAISFGANFVVLSLLIHLVGLHEGWSQIIAGGVYVLVTYLLGKTFVFRKA